MKRTLSIARAKARFAEFVRRAESGETVVLTRHGRPVAQLEPTARHDAGTSDARGEVREAAGRYEMARPDAVAAPTAGAVESRREALERFLEESIWPRLPEDQLGGRVDRREREEILGYGSDGV